MNDIPVVMLHCVNKGTTKHPMYDLLLYPDEFEAYIHTFKHKGYQLVSVSDLIEGRFNEQIPVAVLTFDDGFQDTYTVVQPILAQYGAKATVFVNPSYLSERQDQKTDWGFLTLEQLRNMNHDNVLDIQAHTMTHEFIFTSDRIIDVYTPDKYDKYYWLAWMLFPESPRNWGTDAYSYRDRIPVGFPIFTYGRRLSCRKFIPDDAFVKKAIQTYQDNRDITAAKIDVITGTRGIYETTDAYLECVHWQIEECKRYLERELHKEISSICFPGGAFTHDGIDVVRKAGYRCYMNAQRFISNDNFKNLQEIQTKKFGTLNRMSFATRRNHLISNKVMARVVCSITLDAYQQKRFFVIAKKLLRKI